MGLKKERTHEIVAAALREGDEYAKAEYGITHETLRRYKRFYRQQLDESGDATIEDPSTDRLLRDIAGKLSRKELEAIAKSGAINRSHELVTTDWFDGDTLTIGVIADTHIGSLYFREDWFDGAVSQFAKRGVDAVFHVGDITEGMSNRPGHIYELKHLGYSEQKDAAIQQLKKLSDWHIYSIDGNHDRWFIKSTGAKVVEDIARELDNMEFIGHDTGTVEIGGIQIQLWHGEDGSSYAKSYRVQKVVESIPVDSRPDVLLTGHVHKQGTWMEQDVYAVLSGCLQNQTPWMRSKRLKAEPGFYVISMDINDGTIVRFAPEFYPYYY